MVVSDIAGRILIVEDYSDFRVILGSILRPVGYEVFEAASGQEGIEKALAEVPDLIIMDLGLPGMNGIEATIRLKQNPKTARIPIIAYTVWGEEFRYKATEAGMEEFVGKSTPPPVLRNIIAKFMKKSS